MNSSMSDAQWADSDWDREQQRILSDFDRRVQEIRAEEAAWMRAQAMADDAYWSRVERLLGDYEYPEAQP